MCWIFKEKQFLVATQKHIFRRDFMVLSSSWVGCTVPLTHRLCSGPVARRSVEAACPSTSTSLQGGSGFSLSQFEHSSQILKPSKSLSGLNGTNLHLSQLLVLMTPINFTVPYILKDTPCQICERFAPC